VDDRDGTVGGVDRSVVGSRDCQHNMFIRERNETALRYLPEEGKYDCMVTTKCDDPWVMFAIGGNGDECSPVSTS
jgi:hypothetical protein